MDRAYGDLDYRTSGVGSDLHWSCCGMTRVSCKSVRRVVEMGNITVETYGSLQRLISLYTFRTITCALIQVDGGDPCRTIHSSWA